MNFDNIIYSVRFDSEHFSISKYGVVPIVEEVAARVGTSIGATNAALGIDSTSNSLNDFAWTFYDSNGKELMLISNIRKENNIFISNNSKESLKYSDYIYSSSYDIDKENVLKITTLYMKAISEMEPDENVSFIDRFDKVSKSTEDMKLTNWEIINVGNNLYCAAGNVYNDTRGRFFDGEYITTSYIKRIDFERGILYTKNSVYRLE